MANSVGKNPIVADTSGTSLQESEANIQAIVYVGGTTAGAACQLLDGPAGDIIFEAKTSAANETITLTLIEPLRVSGLYLNTLDSLGKILIYTWPSKRSYYS